MSYLAIRIEEFYNSNHSHKDGKFTSGGAGGTSRAIKAGHGMGQASWKMSPGQIARQKAADKALGRSPTITQIVKREQARGVGPARDVSPHATQGRAGSSPEQYRANQLLLIKTRDKVRKRLAQRHKWDAKEKSVKDEMYGDRKHLYDDPEMYEAETEAFYNSNHSPTDGKFSSGRSKFMTGSEAAAVRKALGVHGEAVSSPRARSADEEVQRKLDETNFLRSQFNLPPIAASPKQTVRNGRFTGNRLSGEGLHPSVAAALQRSAGKVNPKFVEMKNREARQTRLAQTNRARANYGMPPITQEFYNHAHDSKSGKFSGGSLHTQSAEHARVGLVNSARAKYGMAPLAEATMRKHLRVTVGVSRAQAAAKIYGEGSPQHKAAIKQFGK